MRATVVCSMRNEGAFLLEWVCWYRMLGFTDILVVTNDCSDHSPALLQALAAAGWLHHLDCAVLPGEKVVAAKLKLARRHRSLRRADRVLVCDVDEFLVIHRGAGLLADLLAVAPDALAMAINWRVFGTSGWLHWEDGLTHRQFLRAGPTRNPISRWIKVIHGQPLAFRALGEHGPKLPDPARLTGAVRLVNSEGAEVPGWGGSVYLRQLPQALTTHAVAQMNHYMLRSEDSWALKRGSLSAVAGKDRYNDSYYESTNRNELEDTSALRHAARFDAIHAEAMALPEVARLHHLCCADYAARLAEAAGIAPQADARWCWHMGQAGG